MRDEIRGPKIALTSAPGRAGIASVRVAGTDVSARLAPVLGNLVCANRVRAGPALISIRDPVRDEELDRAVARWRRLDDTEILDLHLHGGSVIVDRVLDVLTGLGCLLVPADALVVLEETARGRTPRGSRLISLLPVACGLSACECLLAQAELDLGGWHARPGEDTGRIADLAVAALARSPLGRACLTPPRIAVIGPANAGKSSLVNALAGRERVLVDADPGTTRDVLAVDVMLGGFEVVMLDTAGEREAASAPEREGQRLGRRAREQADLVLEIADGREPGKVCQAAPPPDLVVLTRADRPDCRPPAGVRELAVSSVDGRGLDELRGWIQSRLGLDIEEATADLVPVGAREEQLLAELVAAAEATPGHVPGLLDQLHGSVQAPGDREVHPPSRDRRGPM